MKTSSGHPYWGCKSRLSLRSTNQWKATHPTWGCKSRSNAETLCSANQWKATRPPWGCNLRSNAETYLYSEKQHIHPEDATRDQMQRLIFTLCQSVKINTSNLRMQIKICTLCQSVTSNTSPKRIQIEIKCRDLLVENFLNSSKHSLLLILVLIWREV